VGEAHIAQIYPSLISFGLRLLEWQRRTAGVGELTVKRILRIAFLGDWSWVSKILYGQPGSVVMVRVGQIARCIVLVDKTAVPR
jgi:hypothetical protein